MIIFQRVQEIWSGQESVTEGQTNGQTDGQTDRQMKAISIIPHPLRGGGLIKFQENISNSFQVTERTQVYYRNY